MVLAQTPIASEPLQRTACKAYDPSGSGPLECIETASFHELLHQNSGRTTWLPLWKVCIPDTSGTSKPSLLLPASVAKHHFLQSYLTQILST